VPGFSTEEWRRQAIEAYRAVDCEGTARVDFLLEAATGKLYLNEINTMPDFTSISMYPKMWEHSGISFPELIDQFDRTGAPAAPAEKGDAIYAVKDASLTPQPAASAPGCASRKKSV
jgi:D-ala D-ala ligase C-terminus